VAQPLRLRILGTPGIARETGVPENALPGQAMALLAVLACAADRGIGREKLLTLLWPESPTPAASHRLSQLAHSIRRCLASPGLIAGTGDLRLDREAIACDLWEFEEARRAGQLERAAELYGGPFLDGFYLAGGAEFERWAEARRSAFAREFQETLEALAVQAEVRDDSLAASEWWGQLSRHEPLSSRVTMHLMTALAASGERARALAQAQAYQHQVRVELDAEPSPAVLALARLLRREPQAGAAGPPAGPAIGVLPLVALGDDADARSLADGLTEELMTAIGKLPGVRVVSRAALTTAERVTSDLRELGARLGLTALLEGSVRVADGRMRLSVRLVDVVDGCQRWTERWERAAGETMAAEDALASEVADRVGRRLTSDPWAQDLP
jgi:DNA-binding SARP family transcriptional activator